MNGIIIQNGTQVGICDSRCWTAKSPRCSCPCNGRHHGHGAAFAMAEMVKLVKQEKQANKKGWRPGVVVHGQLPLL